MVFLQVVADCLVPRCHESKGTTGLKTPARCAIAGLRYGTSENAVKTQIWIAVSVSVLVALLRKRLDLEASL
ncbi:MAG: hypothetical protein NTY38_11080 [Acidobacteria bacterium]|nr:hypothetical protein [Acidobacteriota bacterium]